MTLVRERGGEGGAPRERSRLTCSAQTRPQLEIDLNQESMASRCRYRAGVEVEGRRVSCSLGARERREERMSRLIVIFLLFVVAGLCEIGGGHLVWGWMR